MSGHTPGPWSVHHITGNGLGGSYDHYEVRGHGRVLFTNYNREDADRKVNASLIAAAPDLLEALIKLLEFLQPSGSPEEHDIQAAGYAAIARAKGEA